MALPTDNLSRVIGGFFKQATNVFSFRYQRMTDEGAAHVSSVGIAGTLYTQTVVALAGVRQRKTFDPPVKYFEIEVRAGAATPDPDEAVLYCCDAPTTTVADDWLTETNIAPRHCIKSGDGIVPHYFDGATITHVDLIGVGTTIDQDVTIKGVR